MSAVLSALPALPELVEPASKLNGKPLRIKPRVALGEVTPNNLGTVRKLHNCLFPVSYSARFYSDLLDPSTCPEDYTKLVFYQDLPVGVLVCRLEEEERAPPRTIGEAAPGGAKDEEDEKKELDTGKSYKLYVMTLGVLGPYRKQGLGSKLIHHVLSLAHASHDQPFPPSPPSSTEPPVASTSTLPPPVPTPSTSSGASTSAKKKGKKPASSAPPPPPAQKAEDEKKAAEKKKKKEEEEEEKEPLKPRISSVYLHVQVGNDEARKFWEKWGFEVKETVPGYYRKIEPRDAWLLERKTAPAA
ncbi:hypothetical protein JCM8097_004138 [Rhodosporidiobolus ruineniae]